jgi:hypothetical protein
MKKWQVPIPIGEAMDYKRQVYDAMNMMLIGSASRTGRQIITMQGVPTMTVTPQQY